MAPHSPRPAAAPGFAPRALRALPTPASFPASPRKAPGGSCARVAPGAALAVVLLAAGLVRGPLVWHPALPSAPTAPPALATAPPRTVAPSRAAVPRATVVPRRPERPSTQAIRAAEPRLAAVARAPPFPRLPPEPRPTPPLPTPPPAPPLGHLPDWVQAGASTDLYDGSADGAQPLATLPPYAFLRVRGARDARLQVDVAPPDGAPQTGWVNPKDVRPSEPGSGWLQTVAAAPLYAVPAGDVQPYLQLEPGQAVRQLADPMDGRVPVRVYSADFATLVGDGWVPAEALAPAAPPQASVPPRDGGDAKPNPYRDDAEGFIRAVAAAAQLSSAKSGVPVAVTVAQAILESSWGDSLLTRRANNLFGIKALGGIGDD